MTRARGQGQRRYDHSRLRGWLHDRMVEQGWVHADGTPNASELARRLGHDRNVAAYRWLTGKVAPSQQACEELAALFGARVEYVQRLAGWLPPEEAPVDPWWEQIEQRASRIRWDEQKAATILALIDLFHRQEREAAGVSRPGAAANGRPPAPDD